METTKRLYRTRKPDKIIGGVCGGIAKYFNTDPVVIRLLFVILVLIPVCNIALIAYIVAWIITPLEKLEVKSKPEEPKDEPIVV